MSEMPTTRRTAFQIIFRIAGISSVCSSCSAPKNGVVSAEAVKGSEEEVGCGAVLCASIIDVTLLKGGNKIMKPWHILQDRRHAKSDGQP